MDGAIRSNGNASVHLMEMISLATIAGIGSEAGRIFLLLSMLGNKSKTWTKPVHKKKTWT
jgi:hypothetical protein